MSKDIEVRVEICDSDNICELAEVKQGYLDENHVAMALVRAVNGACAQLGIEAPGPLFAQAAEQTPRPPIIDHVARMQMHTINETLTRMGYEHDGGAFAVLGVVGKLEGQARVARALGPDFAVTLKAARERYQTARLIGDHADQVGVGALKPSEITSLLRAVATLGDLLFQMRAIEPEPVTNGDGSTTVTLTESVEIGTPATAPGAVQ